LEEIKMKKMIATLAAVALFAGPALADLSTLPRVTIPKGAYTVQPAGVDAGGERGIDPTPIYNNTTFGPTTYHIQNSGLFIGDDAHMDGTTITSIRWVYSDGGTASFSSSVAFFYNTANDAGPLLGNTVTFVSGTQVYGAVFNVTGLPAATANNPTGGWIITVGLPALVTGPDVWVGFNSTSTTPQGAQAPGFRAGLRGGGVLTAGFSHNLHFAGFFTGPTATSFFSAGSTLTGNLRMQLGGVPEPAAAALLAMGGLVALRRRRA
jgi:hypothetical protein